MNVRILIVEDDESIRLLLVRHLEGNGFVCVGAGSAAEARATLAMQQFELLLSDVNLPGESGLNLLQSTVAEFPDMAVLMVTGIDDPAVAQVAAEAGAYGYVVKPFSRNELFINVAAALHRRRLKVENEAHRRELAQTIRDRTEDLWEMTQLLANADDQVRASVEELVRRLSLATELRDLETARHIDRMSRYSALLASAAGFDLELCEQVRLASRLHDVGKIGVPDLVLRKAGKYTAADHEIMKRHADVGHELLEGSTGTGADLMELAAQIAWTHHEWWDGSGYPRGLSGDAIPVEGRIAAIADVFDALLSERPYKAAMPLDEVVQVMNEQKATHFDPELLEIFMDRVESMSAVAYAVAD